VGRPPINCKTCGAIRGQAKPPEQWFTKQQVAGLLAVTVREVSRLIQRGVLNANKKPSPTVGCARNTVRISQSDLEAYRSSAFKSTAAR
jgi:hypothetical protein